MSPSELDSSSPKEIKTTNPIKIVASLKQLTSRRIQLTEKLEAEIFKLQAKYSEEFYEIQEEVSAIANGEREAMPEDYNTVITSEEVCNDIWESLNSSVPFISESDKILKDYWIVVMKNSGIFEGIITEIDEKILKYLKKIHVVYSSPETPYVPPYSVPKDQMFESNGIAIEFYFDANDYFTNETLFKFYKLGYYHQGEKVWDFDGLKAVDTLGSKIDWNPGCDATVKKISKKRRNKRTGKVDIRESTERCESFFRFFSSNYNEEFEDSGNKPSEEEALALHNTFLDADYDLGCFIINSIVPRSVMYYLNEVDDDFSDGDEDDEDEDETESSDNDCQRPGYANSPFKKCTNHPSHGMKYIEKKDAPKKGPQNRHNGSGNPNKR